MATSTRWWPSDSPSGADQAPVPANQPKLAGTGPISSEGSTASTVVPTMLNVTGVMIGSPPPVTGGSHSGRGLLSTAAPVNAVPFQLTRTWNSCEPQFL